MLYLKTNNGAVLLFVINNKLMENATLSDNTHNIQTLIQLKKLISRFANLKEYNCIRARRFTRRRTYRRKSSSVSDPAFIHSDVNKSVDLTMALTNRKPKRNNLSLSISEISFQKHLDNIYTEKQYSLISISFISLIEKYKATSWVKIQSNEHLAHIVIIKQFFLDCFVCENSFWTFLIDPMFETTWIDLSLFIKCLENIQERNN